MVKRLLLLRHGKSSWDHPGLDDIDRPLSGRGIKASKAIGTFMAEQNLWPQLILCSAARRTRETLDILEDHMDAILPTRLEARLYDADRADVLERLSGVDDETESVMIIGHNPTMQDVALDLIGSGDLEARDLMLAKYPTGALTVIRFDVGLWRDVRSAGGFLEHFVRPRDL